MSESRRPAVHVVAGALIREGRVLIAQRPEGKPLTGFWEFPGGKLDLGETAYQALVRELREELGVDVSAAELLIDYTHPYSERDVRLELWLVTEFRGEPQSLDAQSFKWVTIKELEQTNLLEADGPMVDVLRKLLPG